MSYIEGDWGTEKVVIDLSDFPESIPSAEVERWKAEYRERVTRATEEATAIMQARMEETPEEFQVEEIPEEHCVGIGTTLIAVKNKYGIRLVELPVIRLANRISVGYFPTFGQMGRLLIKAAAQSELSFDPPVESDHASKLIWLATLSIMCSEDAVEGMFGLSSSPELGAAFLSVGCEAVNMTPDSLAEFTANCIRHLEKLGGLPLLDKILSERGSSAASNQSVLVSPPKGTPIQ